MNIYLPTWQFLPLFLALVCNISVATPSVPTPTPTEIRKEIQQQILSTSYHLMEVLQSKRDALKHNPADIHKLMDEVLVPHLDFEQTARLALGPYWRRATLEQRLLFTEQFKRLLVRTYTAAFLQANDWKIAFLPSPIRSEARNIVIRTQILRPNGPGVSINYRMRRKNGQWKAYDVSVEGISLVTTYRSTFKKEVRSGGLDQLIKRMTARNNQVVSSATP